MSFLSRLFLAAFLVTVLSVPALAEGKTVEGKLPTLVSVPVDDSPAKKTEVPFRTDAGLITAEYYLSTGKYTQAIDVANAVINRHPRDADAYTYRGYAYQQLGDTKKATENYARAIAFDPTHLGANKYLADIFLQNGDLARALEQMQAIRLICNNTNCAELDELEADINKFKRAGQVPAHNGEQ